MLALVKYKARPSHEKYCRTKLPASSPNSSHSMQRLHRVLERIEIDSSLEREAIVLEGWDEAGGKRSATRSKSDKSAAGGGGASFTRRDILSLSVAGVADAASFWAGAGRRDPENIEAVWNGIRFFDEAYLTAAKDTQCHCGEAGLEKPIIRGNA